MYKLNPTKLEKIDEVEESDRSDMNFGDAMKLVRAPDRKNIYSGSNSIGALGRNRNSLFSQTKNENQRDFAQKVTETMTNKQ